MKKKLLTLLLVYISIIEITNAQIPTKKEKENLASQRDILKSEIFKTLDLKGRERYFLAEKQWTKKIAEEVHNYKKNADLTILKINQDILAFWEKYIKDPRKKIEIPPLSNPYYELGEKNIQKISNYDNDEPEDYIFHPPNENTDLLNNEKIYNLYQDDEWLVNISSRHFSGEDTWVSNLKFYSSKTLKLVTDVSIFGAVNSIHKNIDDVFTLHLGGNGLGDSRSSFCAIDPIKKEFSWLNLKDSSLSGVYVTLAKNYGLQFSKISNKYFSSYLYETVTLDNKKASIENADNNLGGLPFVGIINKRIIGEKNFWNEADDRLENSIQFINNNTSLVLVSEDGKQNIHLVKSHEDGTICDISLTEITSNLIKNNDKKTHISGLYKNGTLYYVKENSLYLHNKKISKKIDKYKSYIYCSNSILAFSTVPSNHVTGIDSGFAEPRNLLNTRYRDNYVGTTPLSAICKIDSNGNEKKCDSPVILQETNTSLFSIHGDSSLVSKYNWSDINTGLGESFYFVYNLNSNLTVGYPIIGDNTLSPLGPGYINFGKSPENWLLYSYCDYFDSGISFSIQAQNINDHKIITLQHTPHIATPLEIRLKVNGSFQLIFSCVGITELLEYSKDGVFQRILAEWKSPPQEGDPLLLSERNLIFIPKVGGYDAYRIFGEGKPEKAFEIYFRGSSDFVILLPNGYYAGSPGCERLISLQAGDGRVDASAIAPWKNRPAEVIKALGGDPKDADLLGKVTERWLKKIGFDPSTPKPSASEIAKVSVTQMPPLWATSSQVSFPIEVTSGNEALKEVAVRVNGVLQKSFSGSELNVPKGRHATLTASVNLAEGQNWIEVTATDAKGRPGNLEHFRTILPKASETPKRYIVAMGCSDYDRPELHLQFAAKDAGDVLKTFSEAGGRECKTLLLTNKEVGPEALDKIKAFTADTKESDEVILFCAGHGLLDEHLDYVYAGHQIDPEHPGQTGIKLDALLDSISSGKSLKRLVLMDTCQSGSVGEQEEMKLAKNTTELPRGVRAIKSRGLKVVGTANLTGGDQQRFIEEMFLLPGQHRGINIIGASGGAEYAMESDKWNNGVFTSALIEGLRDQKADMDHRGRISVGDLKTYLAQRVPELTGGAQKPSVVAFEQDQNFDLVGHPIQAPKEVKVAKTSINEDGLDSKGLLDLGTRYIKGEGVTIDPLKAEALAKKSADQGNVDAEFALGIWKFRGNTPPKDEVEGKRWIKKAADHGNAQAQSIMKLSELETELKADPKNRPLLAQILQSYLILGMLPELDKTISKAISVTPNDIPFLRDMINLYATQQLIPQALDVATKLQQVQPDQWDVPYTIAKFQLLLGQKDKAYGSLHKTVLLGGSVALANIQKEPLWNPEKSDPAFKKAINLPKK